MLFGLPILFALPKAAATLELRLLCFVLWEIVRLKKTLLILIIERTSLYTGILARYLESAFPFSLLLLFILLVLFGE